MASNLVLGFTDERTTCECCGKSGLKGTYAVERDNIISYFGSTCAFKKHGFSKESLKVADKKYDAEKSEIKTAKLLGYAGDDYTGAVAYRAELKRGADASIREWRQAHGLPPVPEEIKWIH